jgi:alpha-glucoside transport system substrate-binding protein
MGDTIPGGFGTAEFNGVTSFVNGEDLTTILAGITTVQEAALK